MGLKIGKIYKSKFYLICVQNFQGIIEVSKYKPSLIYKTKQQAELYFKLDFGYYKNSLGLIIEPIESNTNMIVLETKGKYTKVLYNGKVGWIVFSEKHGLEKTV